MTVPATPAPAAPSAAALARRIDGLPVSRFHKRSLTIVGMANFFDGFDNLAIAFALPLLAVLWKLSPFEIGLLVSGGYAGQAIGSVAGGWLAHRLGRIRVLGWSVGLLSVLSLACALSWSYASLLVGRFLQGLALGAEVPVAVTYINETTPARHRGRQIFVLQMLFTAGILCISIGALWIVPSFGWRALFVVGCLPLLLLPAIFRLPEPPAWLFIKGRRREAEHSLRRIEGRAADYQVSDFGGTEPATAPNPAAPASAMSSLLGRGLARASVGAWIVNLASSTLLYGLSSWLPTLYTGIFKLPVETALLYGLAGTFAGLAASILGMFIIDRLGRRGVFLLGFALASFTLALLALRGDALTARELVVGGPLAILFASMLVSCSYVYLPELYPANLRSLGVGVGSACLRVGSITGPLVIGLTVGQAGLGGLFWVLTAITVAGLLATLLIVRPARDHPA